MNTNGITVHSSEIAPVKALKPHPSNYRDHPESQRAHLVDSMGEHGFYRNVVIAEDGTILAGHGVVEAATAAGLQEIPVVRLPIPADDPRALKILTGDNEIARQAIIDDRVLAELLREIRDTDGLAGTGFDDAMLANLVQVTRTSAEIPDFDAAAEWIGMPEFNTGDERQILLVLRFDSEEGRDSFIKERGIIIIKKMRKTWSAWWPPRERQDLASLRFDG